MNPVLKQKSSTSSLTSLLLKSHYNALSLFYLRTGIVSSQGYFAVRTSGKPNSLCSCEKWADRKRQWGVCL